MFTGIIEEVGRVARIENRNGSRRLTVSASRLTRELRKGDSIAVSGVCLTAVEITPKSFAADLAPETWKRTSFSRIKPGAQVNLELPMRADGRFGGHIVQGHVDGTGRFDALKKIAGGEDYWLQIEIPPQLARYVIFKGSLSVEGISLTVAKVEARVEGQFENRVEKKKTGGTKVAAAIIPHTVKMTNLKSLKAGDAVNLEVDMVAKYVEKMIKGGSPNSSLTVERLLREGF
jgi:riboflavin synthase